MSAAVALETIQLGPQPGPQTDLLSTTADICIFGGGAGGGKSYGLLLEPLRHLNNPLFGCVIFRRNSTQVRNEGGLWDDSMGLYSQLGARPREAQLEWVFPSGMKIKFAHLEHEKTVYDWQGAQIGLLCVGGGTPVLMADGSYLRIEGITAGQMVSTLKGPRLVTKTHARRKERCVRVKTYGSDGKFIGEQVQPCSHPVLTSFGWQSWDDLKRLFGKDSFATQHDGPHKFSLPAKQISYVRQPSFEQKPMDPARVLEQGLSCLCNSGGGGSPASLIGDQNHNEVCEARLLRYSRPQSLTAPIVLFSPQSRLASDKLASANDEIFSVAMTCGKLSDILLHLKCCNHSIQARLAILLQLFSELALDSCENVYIKDLGRFLASYKLLRQTNNFEDLLLSFADPAYKNSNPLLRVVQDALRWLEPAGSRGGCCAYNDLCGEHTHRHLTVFLSCLRQLNDAAERFFLFLSKRDAILLAPVRSQICRIEYAHPYTKEARHSSVSVEIGASVWTPCESDEDVFDLSIEGEAHYITESGSINKNCFDELTHFTEKQFFYMLSRNRSSSGVPGYIRATCNPDCDHFSRKLIDWWVGPDGYPIKERSGVIRYFIRINDTLVWGDSREELIAKHGKVLPKSLTFIPSSIHDNKILMAKDPAYLANLQALSRVDRLRLEGGNWNVRATAGNFFRREWFTIKDAVPAGWSGAIRAWDRAATRPNPENPDPDWTRGLKMLRYPDGSFGIVDLKSLRGTPGEVETLIKSTASHDSFLVKIMAQQDPGSAGVAEALQFTKLLAGYNVRTATFQKDKITRAKAYSAQAEAGNIWVLRAPWNEEFFSEHENFPDGAHDDVVDCGSLAFNDLCGGHSLFDVK